MELAVIIDPAFSTNTDSDDCAIKVM